VREDITERAPVPSRARRAVDRDAVTDAAPAYGRRDAGRKGTCDRMLYVMVADDDVSFEEGLRQTLDKYVDSEQLDLELAGWDDRPPNPLKPHDVVIHGGVTNADYGSQFVRYFVPILPLFGVGACKLAIDLEIEDGSGRTKNVRSSARQVMGLFGGSSNLMMKTNVKILTHRTAKAMARLLTGRTFLNCTAYQCALTALVTGLLSFIPFLGLLMGPIGAICGLIAFAVINSRELPRRKGMAIAGTILSVVGFISSIGWIALLAMSGK